MEFYRTYGDEEKVYGELYSLRLLFEEDTKWWEKLPKLKESSDCFNFPITAFTISLLRILEYGSKGENDFGQLNKLATKHQISQTEIMLRILFYARFTPIDLATEYLRDVNDALKSDFTDWSNLLDGRRTLIFLAKKQLTRIQTHVIGQMENETCPNFKELLMGRQKCEDRLKTNSDEETGATIKDLIDKEKIVQIRSELLNLFKGMDSYNGNKVLKELILSSRSGGVELVALKGTKVQIPITLVTHEMVCLLERHNDIENIMPDRRWKYSHFELLQIEERLRGQEVMIGKVIRASINANELGEKLRQYFNFDSEDIDAMNDKKSDGDNAMLKAAKMVMKYFRPQCRRSVSTTNLIPEGWSNGLTLPRHDVSEAISNISREYRLAMKGAEERGFPDKWKALLTARAQMVRTPECGGKLKSRSERFGKLGDEIKAINEMMLQQDDLTLMLYDNPRSQRYLVLKAGEGDLEYIPIESRFWTNVPQTGLKEAMNSD